MRTKTELKKIAKEALLDIIPNTYYYVSDNQEDFEIDDEELDVVCSYIKKYENAIIKLINK